MKTDNRERLIDAASKLFRSQGYAETSVKDLLSATDVARSNFYYHFDGKLDVARELARRWVVGYEEAVTAGWAETESAEERLALLVRHLNAEEAGEEMPDPRIGVLALEMASHDEEVRELVAGFLERQEERFRTILRESGGPGARANGSRSAVGVAALNGAVFLSHARRDPGALRRVEEGLLEVLESR